MRCPTTVPLAPLLLAASLLSLSSTATAIQLKDELNAGWTFGLMPRDTSSENLQIFTGALGGAEADPITKSSDSSRPYEVNGDTFPDFATAAGRSCDNQKNACANIANSGGGSFTVGDCDSQNNECKSTVSAAAVTTFSDGNGQLALVTSTPELDIFCEL
ncbi:hypothetical protein CFIMG_006517RA [Ceratocystis fimbriata CBS 114723]|uniref:Uncharacterized protein n=1 Tax=Ceratocystis fimbriata CBS 114723 TaxID=1035309 RepID=A0A2C5WVU4_9PEZI|nr:hypothetical protein CFIMG_006517RA [Ceratocystis fimbriata CBS 114723]